MNFSIILASRERATLLDTLLNSIVATTSDKNNCEVICILDSDDRQSRRFIDRFSKTCSFAKFFFRDRVPNLNDDYLNWAWRNYSSGDNILVVNDDVVFRTHNWDQIAISHLSRYLSDKPDGVAYGLIQDGLKDHAFGLNYGCFPLVTRKAAELFGFVMPPQFPGWGADIAVYRIYSAIGRICEIPIVLDHISHHNGSRTRDHISHGVEKRSNGSISPIQLDIVPYTDRFFKLLGGSKQGTAMITGATITGVTLIDAIIVGGKIEGGKVVGGCIKGGKLVGGLIKSGTVEGDFQSGFIGGAGDVVFDIA